MVQRLGQRTNSRIENGDGRGIIGAGQFRNLGAFPILAESVECRRFDAPARCLRFQRFLRITDREMADLGGAATDARIDLPVDNQPAADAGTASLRRVRLGFATTHRASKDHPVSENFGRKEYRRQATVRRRKG